MSYQDSNSWVKLRLRYVLVPTCDIRSANTAVSVICMYIFWIYIYIYIYRSIYRHVFPCTTAHQCSLEQSERVSPITLAHALVSDYRMWDSTGDDNIHAVWSARGPECSNIHKGSDRCKYIYIYEINKTFNWLNLSLSLEYSLFSVVHLTKYLFNGMF